MVRISKHVQYPVTRKKSPKKVWISSVPEKDDFGRTIDECFIDGATVYGPWAIMSPLSHAMIGKGLGLGLGQKYRRIAGEWVKVEG